VSLVPLKPQAPGVGVTIFVCLTCRRPDEEGVRPGKILFDAVEARLANGAGGEIALRGVECLSVCKRPCTVALAGPGKWTYVVGDLDSYAGVDDILDAAAKFAATDDGIIPWRERPLSFRRGVVSRTPPLPELPGEA
jgi:predicted metal-binding protein